MTSRTFGNPVRGYILPNSAAPAPPEFRCTRPYADGSLPQYGPHDGLDIGNGSSGDDVLAMDAGTVYQAFYDSASGGAGIIRIDHGDGWSTGYAHMDALYVAVGERVTKGQPIARLDNSGWSSGAHLHCDTTHGAERRDPWPMLENSPEDAHAMVKYASDDYERIEPAGRYFLTLEGANFRRLSDRPSTDDPIIETFAAGKKVPAHTRVKGQNVNGSEWWLLAWLWADGAYREGAMHRNSLDEGHDPE